ncbi:hypothetical protein [Streptomyces sp. NPDC001820]|uniref:hypothetical protein n=1 Tax=Streptomyces sp. NPDC001820 TaxID=3364613 RepID=UPI003697B4CA
MDAGILGALIGATATLVTAILAYVVARIQFRDQKRFDHDRVMREERVTAYRAFLNEAMQADGLVRQLASQFAGLSLGDIPDRATRVEVLDQFSARVHDLSASASSVALVGPGLTWDAARDLYHEFTYSEVALGILCSAETDQERSSSYDHFQDGIIVLEKRRDAFIEAARAALGRTLA